MSVGEKGRLPLRRSVGHAGRTLRLQVHWGCVETWNRQSTSKKDSLQGVLRTYTRMSWLQRGLFTVVCDNASSILTNKGDENSGTPDRWRHRGPLYGSRIPFNSLSTTYLRTTSFSTVRGYLTNPTNYFPDSDRRPRLQDPSLEPKSWVIDTLDPLQEVEWLKGKREISSPRIIVATKVSRLHSFSLALHDRPCVFEELFVVDDNS